MKNSSAICFCKKALLPTTLRSNESMNNGQMAKYYVEDNHEAIIDKEIFEAVKTEMARRAEKAKPDSASRKSASFRD